VSKNGVLPIVHSPLMTECQVSPNAPGVPWPGVKLVVEIAPGVLATSGAGSTGTGSLISGMFCRYDNSAPTLTPAMLLESVMP
jgi:hypothetical protein